MLILPHSLQSSGSSLNTKNMMFVLLVHLLQEDEGEDGVGSEAEVVRSESLPQGEKSFIFNDFAKDVTSSLVLWFAYIRIIKSLRNWEHLHRQYISCFVILSLQCQQASRQWWWPVLRTWRPGSGKIFHPEIIYFDQIKINL